jgi:hypothetical protein
MAAFYADQGLRRFTDGSIRSISDMPPIFPDLFRELGHPTLTSLNGTPSDRIGCRSLECVAKSRVRWFELESGGRRVRFTGTTPPLFSAQRNSRAAATLPTPCSATSGDEELHAPNVARGLWRRQRSLWTNVRGRFDEASGVEVIQLFTPPTDISRWRRVVIRERRSCSAEPLYPTGNSKRPNYR